jgi:hypothetical protein
VATTVYYNGVVLHNVTTRQWQQECILDSSGTDLIGHRFQLKFEAYLHIQGAFSSNIGSSSNPPAYIRLAQSTQQFNSIADAYREVVRRLSEPRGPLRVQMGAATVLSCQPTTQATLAEPDRDTSNGPHPRQVNVTHVAGNKVFRVEFAIECNMLLCNPDSAYQAVPGLVLSNRWSIGEEMDSDFFTTRTIRGRMRLSQSNVYAAHSFKYLVIPNLEDGFKRERVAFSVAENGLDCDWEITDKQAMHAAPWPATDISGTYRELTDDGVTMRSEMTVRLKGGPASNPQLLLARAIQVIESRLKLTEKPLGAYIPLGFNLTEYIGDENWVEASAVIQHNFAGELRAALGNLRKECFGKPLQLQPLEGTTAGYACNQHPLPERYGYQPWNDTARSPAVLFMLHCFLQRPCDMEEAHRIQWVEYTPQQGGDGAEREGDYTPSSTGDLPSSTGDLWTQSHKTAVYTIARIVSVWHLDDLYVQLPLAREVEEDSEDATSAIIRLGGTQCAKEYHFELERVGSLPACGQFLREIIEGSSMEGRRVYRKMQICPPTLSVDGNRYVYRVEGYVKYAFKRPMKRDEPFDIGCLPHVNMLPEDRQYAISKFEQP